MNDTTTPTPPAQAPESSGLSLEAIVGRDPRAGHFIVDILSGTDPAEAAAARFGNPAAEAEAEQRGYLRGLNEAARARMNEPGLYEQGAAQPPEEPSPTLLFPGRKSIWD